MDWGPYMSADWASTPKPVLSSVRECLEKQRGQISVTPPGPKKPERYKTSLARSRQRDLMTWKHWNVD
jgi:hypothetical protein